MRKTLPKPEQRETRSFGDKLLSFVFKPDYLFWPILWLLFLLIMMMPMRINHDTAFMLYTGRLLTEGKLLYVDWWDLSPPLVFYVHAIPAFISTYFSLNIIPVYSVFILGIILWSCLSIRKQLVSSQLRISSGDIGLVLLFWAVFSLYVYQQNDFGQKDHLFIVMFLPYAVCRWIRAESGYISTSTAILSGVLGAVGTCIKPTFFLMPIVLEIYLLITYRDFRKIIQPETIGFVLSCFIYIAHFFFLPNEVMINFLDRMPYLYFQLYPKLMAPVSWVHIINTNVFYLLAIFTLIPLVFVNKNCKRLWNLAKLASAMVAAGLGIYLVHFKGFTYHYLSALGSASILLGCLTAEIRTLCIRNKTGIELRFTHKQTFYITFAAILVISSLGLYRAATKTSARFPDSPLMRTIIENSNENDEILVISAERGTLWPSLLQSGRRQASRHGMFEEFPLFYADKARHQNGNLSYHNANNASKEETKILKELHEDIDHFRPKLIIIHDPPHCAICPKSFRMVEYLTKTNVIEHLVSYYEKITDKDDFTTFVRK